MRQTNGVKVIRNGALKIVHLSSKGSLSLGRSSLTTLSAQMFFPVPATNTTHKSSPSSILCNPIPQPLIPHPPPDCSGVILAFTFIVNYWSPVSIYSPGPINLTPLTHKQFGLKAKNDTALLIDKDKLLGEIGISSVDFGK